MSGLPERPERAGLPGRGGMRALMGCRASAGGVVERNAYLTKRYIWWESPGSSDRREHADDRLHRQGHRGDRRSLDVNST